MVVDADTKVHELIRQQGGNALLFKMKDDPRLTPIGRFIRTYSIDELPQFINSLNGTMSIVGPAPRYNAKLMNTMRTCISGSPYVQASPDYGKSAADHTCRPMKPSAWTSTTSTIGQCCST